ncbi:MAG TPA: protein kinase [Nannocystaceae bacterium]|nr:protein kinase [Nannocystaceae bacterium]
MAELDEVGVLIGARDRLDALEREQVWGRLQAGLFGSKPAQSQLDRFVILERLGSGGQGRVYLAFDPKLARRVAIKLVRPEADGDASAQEQLVREAQALAQLADPNIVAVHDVGTFVSQDEEVVFIVMEYVEGPTLAQWLVAAPRSTDDVLARFAECGRGLAHAHAHGVVHRDFKPSNVIVSASGCRILDFGLARAPVSPPSPRAASSSTTAGTPAYMAPEQHEGGAIDARTDQYAFCVALWGALAGERPFGGATSTELAQAKRAGPPLPSDRRGTNRALLQVCARGLAWAPAQRFADMPALLEALARARVARRRRIAAVVLAMIAIVAFVGWRAFDARRRAACTATAASATQLWTDARAPIEHALLATGAVFAADTAAWVDGRIDTFVREWAQERESTCVAERIDRAIGAEVAAARIGCLDAQLQRVEALLGVLAQADLRVVTVAVGMAGALPSAASCREESATSWFAGDDADEVARVLALLDRAGWLRRSGRLDEATALVDEAEAVGSSRMRSRALLERAMTLVAAGHPHDAEPVAKAAWIAAEERGHDEHAIRAMTVLGETIAFGRGDLQESLDLGEAAAARLVHAGLGPRDTFAVARMRAHVANMAGRYAEATMYAEQAVAAARAMAPDHPDVAGALVDLGNVQLRANDYAHGLATFAEAEAITSSAFSASHPDLLAIKNGKAGCLRGLGRLSEALAVTDAALALAEAIHGPAHPIVDMLVANRGMLRAGTGDTTGALHDLEDALARKQARLGSDNRELLGPLLELAQVQAQRGDSQVALAWLDRATKIVETHEHVPDPLSAKAFMLRGEIAEALGQHELACASFRTALARAEDLPALQTQQTVARAATGLSRCE